MQWRVNDITLYNNSERRIFFEPNINFSLILKYFDIAGLIDIVASLLLEYKIVMIID